MHIGIIGAGKVGTALGAYLSVRGIPVSGFYSKTFKSAASAAEFTDTKAYQNLEPLLKASDTLFITTPDGQIAGVWDCIVQCGAADKIVCHFSGSLSSNVFSGAEHAGVKGCSIHPMYAFSDRFSSHLEFHKALLTMEGHPQAVAAMRELFAGLGHQVFTVGSEDKAKYHAAAAMASNAMVGLFQMSIKLLMECGFSKEEGRMLLGPLVAGNGAAMAEKGPIGALTGPVERGDAETVQKHLKALAGSPAETVYRVIGKELVAIAEEKNPQRDYTTLKNIF